MSDNKEFLDRISPFTIVLTVVILMVIGAGLSPLLDIASRPAPKQGKTLSINFWWNGVSPRVIEQEVTSKIEGIVSAVHGVESTSSISKMGHGAVTIQLKKSVNVSAVRFEISSLLRQIHKKLPEGVTYPSLSGGDVVQRNSSKPSTMNLLTYRINADMDGEQIKEYIEQTVSPYLTSIEDVKSIEVSGGVSKYMEIAYDPLVLMNYGINASIIAEGIKSFMGKNDIVGDIQYTDTDNESQRMTLHLATAKFSKELGEMPLTKVGDKIIYLNDLATYEYKEREPNSYFRVNGLSTVNMIVKTDANGNIIKLSETLRNKIEEIKPNLRKGVYLTLTHDAALEMETELQKLIRRTILCLIVLLVFVWVVSRSGKYLSIIFITLLANVLISIIVYYVLDIQLHTFSLAGIAVSFGIIIDSSIVMVDHYSYYKNRKAFLAILAALLTTIGSLVIVFFMPEIVRNDLYDFSRIIIVNLSVALFVSLFFVPAIVSQMGYNKRKVVIRKDKAGYLLRWNLFYNRYICFTQKRKWIYIMLLVLAFGLPFFAMPAKWNAKQNYYGQRKNEPPKWYAEWYDATVGSKFYQSKLHPYASKWLGGTMRLFAGSMGQRTYQKQEREVILHIRGQMPLGGKAIQLNEKVKEIEKFLAQYKEIKRFETTINNGGANIKVEFEQEHKQSSFPYYLENLIIGQLINLGGCDWATYGVSERGFSNSLRLGHRGHRLELYGYNYSRLYKYAEEISEMMSKNGRVTDVIIENAGQSQAEEELYMQFDKHNIANYNVNTRSGYNNLSEILSTNSLGHFTSRYISTQLELRSKRYESFDLWQLKNSYLQLPDRAMTYAGIGEIKKREAKNIIPKRNQEYMLTVAYNFLGNWDLANRFANKTMETVNEKMPVGYRIMQSRWGGYRDEGTQYWLILLIVVIIFFMCSILFESLRLPLTIIMLIPASYIGTFLTFYFSKVNFGTGGFASLVLLSGLVVNAAIYLINEYNYLKASQKRGHAISLQKLYIKAYNHKIVPIFLTILSTVLGLIPFLLEGKADAFWFSFAIGTSGGLLFSIVALVFIMPIFMPLGENKPVEQNKGVNDMPSKHDLQDVEKV